MPRQSGRTAAQPDAAPAPEAFSYGFGVESGVFHHRDSVAYGTNCGTKPNGDDKANSAIHGKSHGEMEDQGQVVRRALSFEETNTDPSQIT